MAGNAYVQGSLLQVTGTFKTQAGVLTDPTTVVLKVKTPAGVTTTYTYGVEAIVRSSVGVFYFNIDVNAAGVWYYRWIGTGAIQAADQASFTCIQSIP